MIDGFLSLYSILPLSDGIGKRAYELLKAYAKSHGLHVFEALIDATAIENGLTPLTPSSDDLNRTRSRYYVISSRW